MTNLGGKIGIAKSNTGGGTGGSTGGSVPTVPTDPSKDGGSLGIVTPVDTTPKLTIQVLSMCQMYSIMTKVQLLPMVV